MEIQNKKQYNSEKKEKNSEKLINSNNKSDENKYGEKESEKLDDSYSRESAYYEESSEKEEENNNNKIGIINNNFLSNKIKRELTKEQKEERIARNINKYCQRNDRILELFGKINDGERARKNINKMMQLLAQDLLDTKRISNKKALISYKKEKLFNKLYDLTLEEYKSFWLTLTQGKYKKGNALLIKSNNISKAIKIYKAIINQRINKINDNKEKKEISVGEKIKIKNNREKEIEKLDNIILGYDPEISSDEDSLDSSVDDSSSDNKSDIKNVEKENEEKISEEKEKKEKEEKKKKEEGDKTREERMKNCCDIEDEIEIFN